MNGKNLLQSAYQTGWKRNWQTLPGFVILAAAFRVGQWLQTSLHLIVPGNILGMFLLLGLLLSGVLPIRWVESAAAAMLWLLPLLFLPIFAVSVQNPDFWSRHGPRFFAAILLGVVALWALVGRAAQYFLQKADASPALAAGTRADGRPTA